LFILHIFVFCFHSYLSLSELLHFPTRRSSDLRLAVGATVFPQRATAESDEPTPIGSLLPYSDDAQHTSASSGGQFSLSVPEDWRSEEHTSELQSRFDLVCRLLLEKKKDIKQK